MSELKRTERIKRVDMSKLSVEQRASFIQFVKDCKQAAPAVTEMQQVAQAIFANVLKTPVWNIAEAPVPESGRPVEQSWDIGGPEVNYVDHIEGFK